jgi:hypothetical protein
MAGWWDMSLRVIRERPKERNRLSGLSGALIFSARVIDPVHVGSGGPSLKGLEGFAKGEGREIEGVEEALDVIRIGGKPAIPGSSLKGAVRSRLELTFRGYNGSVPSCFSVIGDVKIPSWRHREIYRSSSENRGPPCDYLRYGTVCKVCDIFGAPGLASRVHFPNLIFGDEDEISSDLGRIVVIPRGAESEGALLFQGMEPYELGLVLIGMGNLKPLLIGRGKYRGMGRILITPKSWLFTGRSREAFEGLATFEPAKLWERLVQEAKSKYTNYIVEEDFDARAKEVSH